MNQFTIFTKSDKTIWTNNRIIYSIMLPCLVILVLKNYVLQIGDNLFDKFLYGILGITFISGIILKFFGFFKTEPLRGKLDGSIIFEKDSIQINKETFNLEKIRNIEISNNDYYGKLVGTSKGNFNGALSNGVDNFIKIKLYSGEVKIYNYQLYNSDGLQHIRKQLINYYLNGKIEFEDLSKVLGKKSKREIQEFKLEIEKIATGHL